MYTTTNYQSKKQFKEAVEAGKQVRIFQPGPFGSNEPSNGNVCIEGPHYPQPHKWYATATLKDGVVVKVK